MKKILTIVAVIMVMVFALSGCGIIDESDTAGYNVSKEADNFKVYRQITIINNMTDTTLLEFKGWASIEVDEDESQLEIVYRTGKDEYKKDFIGLNDMTTYVITQLDGSKVSPYKYEWTYHSEGSLVPISAKDMDKK